VLIGARTHRAATFTLTILGAAITYALLRTAARILRRRAHSAPPRAVRRPGRSSRQRPG
jgi:hypothetical protein